MKGLLHSKRFRNNLYKWLFMYVGVMLLLITVITYSKYISSLGGEDTSRATKFEVKVNTLNCLISDEENVNTCEKGKFRPTSKIKYYFSVDTSKIEVNAFLVLDVWLDSDFELVKIETVAQDPVSNEFKVIEKLPETAYTVDGHKIRMTEDIDAGQGSLTNYKLTIKYKNGAEGSIIDPRTIIKISYSADQVIN